jgi:HTH-type transcriptional regulator/antitoxin HipB
MRSVIRSSQSLGNSLREHRIAAGLTQQELGRRTKLRQATISNLEQGEGGTLRSLFAVVRELKLEIRLDPRSVAPSLDEIF